MSNTVFTIFVGGNIGPTDPAKILSGITNVRAGDKVEQIIVISSTAGSPGQDMTAQFYSLIPDNGEIIQRGASGDLTASTFLAILSRG